MLLYCLLLLSSNILGAPIRQFLWLDVPSFLTHLTAFWPISILFISSSNILGVLIRELGFWLGVPSALLDTNDDDMAHILLGGVPTRLSEDPCTGIAASDLSAVLGTSTWTILGSSWNMQVGGNSWRYMYTGLECKTLEVQMNQLLQSESDPQFKTYLTMIEIIDELEFCSSLLTR